MDYIKKQLPDSLTKTGGLLLGFGVIIMGMAFVFHPGGPFLVCLWVYKYLVS